MYQFAIHDDPLLPVHDSLITKKGNEFYLQQLMLDTFERVTEGKTRVDITSSLSNDGFREKNKKKDYSKIYAGQEILEAWKTHKESLITHSLMAKYLQSWKKDYSRGSVSKISIVSTITVDILDLAMVSPSVLYITGKKFHTRLLKPETYTLLEMD